MTLTQGSFATLSELVQRFKMITTKLYIDGVKEHRYPPFDKKIWQYIDENPRLWQEDRYFII